MKLMDNLAKRLHEDAGRIDVEISDELERRIDASLRAITPEVPEKQAASPPARPPYFWWASSLTGVAAAVAVIAIANWQPQVEPDAPPATLVADALPPPVDLKAQAAMLTGPLQEELEKLESDLKKAEEKVKRDIGL
jgi:hypothetical protein